jgi:dTDP-4-dehydrorhamnose 3,5-epimerase
VHGAIFDVAVDIRVGSPTYGRHVAEMLTAESWAQLFIPVGFAHGFCALHPDTSVIYKTSDYYAPECDRGLRWNDPALGIDWPVGEMEAGLSDKDRTHPLLSELKPAFAYEP